MGATQTRCAQTSVTLFPFPTAHHRPGSHADLSNCSLRIALDERNCFAVFSNQFNNSPMLVMPPCCASSAMRSEQFCLFRLCIAGDVLLRSEKEGRLSERSELCVPPDCSNTAPGTPKGRCIAVAFLCLLSLARQWLPGRPRQRTFVRRKQQQATSAAKQVRTKFDSINRYCPELLYVASK